MDKPASPTQLDCFDCPQGDKPIPGRYQPGAWLAQPAPEPAPKADRTEPGNQ